MTFEIVNICGKWNSKIGIDIYNSKMKIENRYWQIDLYVLQSCYKFDFQIGGIDKNGIWIC